MFFGFLDFWILDLGILDFVYKNPISVVRPPAGAFFSGKWHISWKKCTVCVFFIDFCGIVCIYCVYFVYFGGGCRPSPRIYPYELILYRNIFKTPVLHNILVLCVRFLYYISYSSSIFLTLVLYLILVLFIMYLVLYILLLSHMLHSCLIIIYLTLSYILV